MFLYWKGVWNGTLAVGVLLLLTVIGSRHLLYFDAALIPYLIATIFAIFASVYRYTVWLSRPPTQMLWKRSWELFWSKRFYKNLILLSQSFVQNMLLQKFIEKRDTYRWVMHLFLAWGCLIAFSVTFPLVLGLLHFSPEEGKGLMYQLFVLGFPTFTFDPYGIVGFFFFNVLNFCSLMVIIGVVMAFYRRMVHMGEITTQTFANDILPLLILFAVSASGLLLTYSTHFLGGQHYRILSTVHCWCVVGLLLYLPFGKFFHLFQRAAQMGATLYIHEKEIGKAAICPKSGEKFSSEVQKEDVKLILKQLGFLYQSEDKNQEYSIQDLSPRSRRLLLMQTQHKRLQGHFDLSIDHSIAHSKEK